MNYNLKYLEKPLLAMEQAANWQRTVDATMQFLEADNVYVYPYDPSIQTNEGELFRHDGSLIYGVNSDSDLYSRIGYKIPPPNPFAEQVVDEAIYLGSISMGWGHYITDGICKAWVAQNKKFQQLVERGVPVYFTSLWVKQTDMSAVWQDILHRVGFDVKLLPITERTKFKHVYYPTPSLFIDENGHRRYTKEFADTIELLCKSSKLKSGKTYDKIYFSRDKLMPKAAEFGEKTIQKYFCKAGYKIMYPEQMTIDEQIWYLQHCQHFATTMGSISHNALLLPKSADCVFIHKAAYSNEYQTIINDVKNLNVTYIDAHLTLFDRYAYFLYPSKQLKRFFVDQFNINITENFDRKKYMDYMAICMKMPNFKEKIILPEYYFEILADEMRHSDQTFLKYLYHIILNQLGNSYIKKSLIKFVRKFRR